MKYWLVLTNEWFGCFQMDNWEVTCPESGAGFLVMRIKQSCRLLKKKKNRCTWKTTNWVKMILCWMMKEWKGATGPEPCASAPAAEMIPLLQLVIVCLSQGPQMPDWSHFNFKNVKIHKITIHTYCVLPKPAAAPSQTFSLSPFVF